MSDLRCPVCADDGWIDVLDDEGFPVGAMDCPRLDDPGHAAFNASGLIPYRAVPAGSDGEDRPDE